MTNRQNLVEKINEVYVANNKRYVEVFNSVKEVEDVTEIEFFEDNYSVDINKLNYPVLVFDCEGSLGNPIFESNVSDVEILEEADSYFDKR